MSKFYDEDGEEWPMNDYFGEPIKKGVVNMGRNMNNQIVNYDPHYTNDRFEQAQVVWGSEEKDMHMEIVYSDRLWQWDYNKAKAASEFASGKFPVRTANWVQAFLSEYYDRSVEIRCIMAGFNVSNGYPYQVFFFRNKR